MNYEINEKTMAIVAMGEEKSKVIEDSREFIFEDNAFNIIDYSCKFFGSSYEGRKEGARSILNMNYKVPIIVENSRNLIFFPTAAPTSIDCSWVSLNNIESVIEKEFNSSKIIFKNGQELEIPVSRRIIDNQILRASRLDLIMRDRNNRYFNIKNS